MTPRRWQNKIGSSWLGGVWRGAGRRRFHQLYKRVREAVGGQDFEIDEPLYDYHTMEVEIHREVERGHPWVSVGAKSLRSDYDCQKASDWVIPILRRWRTVSQALVVENYGRQELAQIYRELASLGPLYLTADAWESASGEISVSLALSRERNRADCLYFELYPGMAAGKLSEVMRRVETQIAAARGGVFSEEGGCELKEGP